MCEYLNYTGNIFGKCSIYFQDLSFSDTTVHHASVKQSGYIIVSCILCTAGYFSISFQPAEWLSYKRLIFHNYNDGCAPGNCVLVGSKAIRPFLTIALFASSILKLLCS